eukprot:562762-Prymnesium_polylepis.2
MERRQSALLLVWCCAVRLTSGAVVCRVTRVSHTVPARRATAACRDAPVSAVDPRRATRGATQPHTHTRRTDPADRSAETPRGAAAGVECAYGLRLGLGLVHRARCSRHAAAVMPHARRRQYTHPCGGGSDVLPLTSSSSRHEAGPSSRAKTGRTRAGEREAMDVA